MSTFQQYQSIKVVMENFRTTHRFQPLAGRHIQRKLCVHLCMSLKTNGVSKMDATMFESCPYLDIKWNSDFVLKQSEMLSCRLRTDIFNTNGALIAYLQCANPLAPDSTVMSLQKSDLHFASQK